MLACPACYLVVNVGKCKAFSGAIFSASLACVASGSSAQLIASASRVDITDPCNRRFTHHRKNSIHKAAFLVTRALLAIRFD